MSALLGAAASWNDYPILGPYALAINNLTLTGQQIVGADTGRSGILFHNPGVQYKRVLPVGPALVGGTGGILILPQSTFSLLKDNDSQWNINCAWQGVTDNITDTTLTALDFTPNTPGAPEVNLVMRTNLQNPITSPNGIQVAGIGLGSVPVLGADPNRTGVIFQNPGNNALAVCPSNIAASIGAGSIILLPGEEQDVIGNDRVRVNCAWNAIAQAGTTNNLTILTLYG